MNNSELNPYATDLELQANIKAVRVSHLSITMRCSLYSTISIASFMSALALFATNKPQVLIIVACISGVNYAIITILHAADFQCIDENLAAQGKLDREVQSMSDRF